MMNRRQLCDIDLFSHRVSFKQLEQIHCSSILEDIVYSDFAKVLGLLDEVHMYMFLNCIVFLLTSSIAPGINTL